MAAIDDTGNEFIGQGLIFPIQLSKMGSPNIGGGKDLLESSIKAILSWNIGTRFFLGEFGTRLEELLQEPNDLITQVLVKHFTVEVISKWEKRLEVLDVELTERTDNSINIKIRYKVINTKISETFTFPYYSQLIY